MQEQKSKLESANATKDKELSALKQEVESLKKLHPDANATLQASHAKGSEELKQVQEQKSKLESELQEAKTLISLMQREERIDVLTKENDLLRSEVASMAQTSSVESETLQTKVDELNADYARVPRKFAGIGAYLGRLEGNNRRTEEALRRAIENCREELRYRCQGF